MPSVKIYNVTGEVKGTAELSDAHFGVKPKTSFIHRIIVSMEANKRRSIANTKTRGEVSGGGKKPWKQKGTGRARQGSIRSPQWKGGGVTFGPRSERNYEVKINRKEKRLAIFMILSDRVAHEKLFAIDKFPVDEPKTKKLSGWLKNLPVGRKTLIVLAESNPMFLRMVRNIPNVQAVTVNSLSVTDLVRYPTIIFEQSAIPVFESIYAK